MRSAVRHCWAALAFESAGPGHRPKLGQSQGRLWLRPWLGQCKRPKLSVKVILIVHAKIIVFVERWLNLLESPHSRGANGIQVDTRFQWHHHHTPHKSCATRACGQRSYDRKQAPLLSKGWSGGQQGECWSKPNRCPGVWWPGHIGEGYIWSIIASITGSQQGSQLVSVYTGP